MSGSAELGQIAAVAADDLIGRSSAFGGATEPDRELVGIALSKMAEAGLFNLGYLNSDTDHISAEDMKRAVSAVTALGLILPQNPDEMLDIRQLENGLERRGAPSRPRAAIAGNAARKAACADVFSGIRSTAWSRTLTLRCAAGIVRIICAAMWGAASWR
jgi:hypothetical protein